MEKKTRKKREAPISYRPPAELREEFALRVEKSGLSTNAFISKCCLDVDPPRTSRRPALEEKLLCKLLAQAAQISSQLHEIQLANGGENTLLLEQAAAELMLIRAALLKAMGRQP